MASFHIPTGGTFRPFYRSAGGSYGEADSTRAEEHRMLSKTKSDVF